MNEYFRSQTILAGKSYSLDALHNSEGLLSEIEARQGIFLVQMKANQKHLYGDLRHIKEHLSPSTEPETAEKGHGRIDFRCALFFPVNAECLDQRWLKSGIKTLVCVARKSYNIKRGTDSEEISYYVSNKSMKGNEIELFNVIRRHWSVEINNWISDVNFGEDFFRSLKPALLVCFICINSCPKWFIKDQYQQQPK